MFLAWVFNAFAKSFPRLEQCRDGNEPLGLQRASSRCGDEDFVLYIAVAKKLPRMSRL